MEILTLPIQAASPAVSAVQGTSGTNPGQLGAAAAADIFADLLALQLGLSPEAASAVGAANIMAVELDAAGERQAHEEGQSVSADATSQAGLASLAQGLPVLPIAPLVVSPIAPRSVSTRIELPTLPVPVARIADAVQPETPAAAAEQSSQSVEGQALPELLLALSSAQNPLPSAPSLVKQLEVPRQAIAVASAAIAVSANNWPEKLPSQRPGNTSNVVQRADFTQESAELPLVSQSAVGAVQAQRVAAASGIGDPDGSPLPSADRVSSDVEYVGSAQAPTPQTSLPQLPVVGEIPAAHVAAAVGNAQPTQPSAMVAPSVASSAWGGALGEHVVWMVGQQHQGVELHLNPAALGPLEVRLSISDGQANLTFATQHAPVREAIEAATPRLREMLADSGISLGSVSVNVGSFTQSPPGEQAQRQSPTWTGLPPSSDFSSLLPVAVTVLGHKGMVDIFA